MDKEELEKLLDLKGAIKVSKVTAYTNDMKKDISKFRTEIENYKKKNWYKLVIPAILKRFYYVLFIAYNVYLIITTQNVFTAKAAVTLLGAWFGLATVRITNFITNFDKEIAKMHADEKAEEILEQEDIDKEYLKEEYPKYSEDLWNENQELRENIEAAQEEKKKTGEDLAFRYNGEMLDAILKMFSKKYKLPEIKVSKEELDVWALNIQNKIEQRVNEKKSKIDEYEKLSIILREVLFLFEYTLSNSLVNNTNEITINDFVDDLSFADLLSSYITEDDSIELVDTIGNEVEKVRTLEKNKSEE